MFRQFSDNFKCEVCGDKISHSSFLLQKEQQYLVCNSFDCTVVMSQKGTMTSDGFKAHLKFKKNDLQQRKEKEATTQKYIEEIEKKELQENEGIIQLTLEKDFDIKQDILHLFSIPSGFSKLVSVPEKRIKNYTEHLKTTISSAAEFDNASVAENELNTSYDGSHENVLKVENRFEETPVLRTISDKLCGMCKGGCCVLGKDNAHLSVITIRRYMDDNPHLSEQEILELYLSKINSETIENACINNTKTGCALPREMRSDICNGYYCDSLKSFQKEYAGRAEIGKVLAVQRSHTNWNRFDPGVSNKVVSVALVGKDTLQYVDISLEDKNNDQN